MSDEAGNFWGGHEFCWACRVLDGVTPGCIVTQDEVVTGPVLSTATRVARAAKRAFAADGVTLRQNNDAASDQHLFHFHLHVVPRFTGDADRFNAQPQQIAIAEQRLSAERLRQGLAHAPKRETI